MKKYSIAFMLLLFIECSPKISPTDTPLPGSVQDMTLQQIIQGEEADSIITHLHRKIVTEAESYIGMYQGAGSTGTMYITVYPESVQAVEDLTRMADRIRDPEIGGKMGFLHFRELTRYGDNVYMALQHQRAHFFYVRTNKLYWWDVEPQVAISSLQELME